MNHLGIAKLRDATGVGMQEARDLLENFFGRFLLSGGTITLTEWINMSQLSRLAAQDAGERVWAERCAAIGLASQDPSSAARVLAAADGGETLLQAELEKLTARVEQEIKEKAR